MSAFFVAFVDGGFLKASGASAIHKRSHEVVIDGTQLMHWLRGFRAYGPTDELLRAYWYDGALDPTHRGFPAQRRYFDALDSIPGLEVRLGHLVERQPNWHHALRRALRQQGVDVASFARHFEMKPDVIQKGVDTLITMDLIGHSQSSNYEWALLIAGDRDLVQPVWSVQDHGRRVVVAIPKGAGIAPELRRRADQFVTIDEPTLRTFVKARADAAPKLAAIAS
jgi:uncharacterized LabA/DUF88 family protein